MTSDHVRDVVRRVLDARWDEEDTPEENERAWAQARELGWHLLGVDESYGGAGGTFDDRLTLAEVLGAFGRRGPYLEVNTATARLAGVHGLDHVALERGEVAVIGADDFGAPAGLGYLDAFDPLPQVVVVVGREALVAAPVARMTTSPAGEPLAVVAWDGARRLGGPELAATLGRDLDLTRCARIVGGCRAVARMSARYALEREQFGRPLIRFQAVGDLVARQRAASDLADAALQAARRVSDESLDELVDAAVWVCVDAAGTTASLAHQVHGAMGITHEHRLHRLTRQLWSWRDQLGARHARADDLGRRAIELGDEALWDRLAPEQHRPSHSDHGDHATVPTDRNPT